MAVSGGQRNHYVLRPDLQQTSCRGQTGVAGTAWQQPADGPAWDVAGGAAVQADLDRTPCGAVACARPPCHNAAAAHFNF